MEKININGIKLSYERKGSGTPLVLIHGFPLDHRIWDKVLPELENQFDLIVPDMRGFGGSTTMDTSCTMDDYASDFAGLLDSLNIQKAVIAGHSMGGYIALAFARNYPDRMLGLALVSSQVLADSPERKEGRYKSASDVEKNGIGGMVEAMFSKLTPDEKLQRLSKDIMGQQSSAGFIGALKAMAERLDSSSFIEGINYPVVIVHGDADALIPVDRGREVKEALASAHLVELPGIGHLPMLESPSETAKALSLFK